MESIQRTAVACSRLRLGQLGYKAYIYMYASWDTPPFQYILEFDFCYWKGSLSSFLQNLLFDVTPRFYSRECIVSNAL